MYCLVSFLFIFFLCIVVIFFGLFLPWSSYISIYTYCIFLFNLSTSLRTFTSQRLIIKYVTSCFIKTWLLKYLAVYVTVCWAPFKQIRWWWRQSTHKNISSIGNQRWSVQGIWLVLSLVASPDSCSRGIQSSRSTAGPGIYDSSIRKEQPCYGLAAWRRWPAPSNRVWMMEAEWYGPFVKIRPPIRNRRDWRSLCNLTTAVILKKNP